MRYLGIDYGAKRIGLAISDKSGRFGFPAGTVRTISDIVKIVRKEKIKKIIVGLPMTLNGKETAQTKIARAFAAALKKTLSLPIEFENELFTTKIAERHTPKDKADASAAALILQSYLDKKRLETRKISNL